MKKEEEIRQNAVKYSEQHCSGYVDGALVNAHIAGAHSRDEEISRMQESLDECRRALFQLRNPWVDTNDESHLPKKDEQIIIAFDDVARTILKYTDKDMFKIWNAHHWMPIPELPKGEQLWQIK